MRLSCVENRLHRAIPENYNQTGLTTENCHYMCEVCFARNRRHFSGCFVCTNTDEIIDFGLCSCNQKNRQLLKTECTTIKDGILVQILLVSNLLVSLATLILSFAKVLLPISLKLIYISQIISLAIFIPAPNQLNLFKFMKILR